MKKNRAWRDVIADILAITKSGAKQTNIMYEANVPYLMAKEYLEFLLKVELLTFDDETSIYKTTKKGKLFLELYEKINELTSLPESGKDGHLPSKKT